MRYLYYVTYLSVGLGGLVVIALAIGLKVRGFKYDDGFLRG
jgi:hypothetical protein